MRMLKIAQASRASLRTRINLPLAFLGLVLVTSSCSNAAATGDAEGKKPAASAKTAFTVAGIRAGMSASEVNLALSKAGFALVHSDDGADWALELRMARTGDKLAFGEPRRGIRAQEFKKGGERISVDYLAMPTGPVAYLITYNAPLAVLEFSRAKAELTRRQGPSSFSNQQAAAPWAMWCAGAPRTARDCLDVSHVSVARDPDGATISAEDPGLRRAQRKLLEAAGGQRPSF